MNSTTFGSFLKQLRIANKFTLREFCETNKLDPGNYSRLERGLFPAPHRDDMIEKYALAIGVKRGSDDWILLFDLAAASRGKIPKDILNDEELMSKLPALFRTIRTNPVDPEKLDALVEDIRRT